MKAPLPDRSRAQPDYFQHRYLATDRYHVACFVAAFPDVPLEKLKGYERLGEAAVDALDPPRSLWEHLASGDDE